MIVLVGALLWSALGPAGLQSRRPQLFGGSLVLEDYRPLTVVDVATAKVTVRLQGVYAQVGAKTYADVEAVPVRTGTMLVNRMTGTFNLLGRDNYVLDTSGPGVGLGRLAGAHGAAGLADGASAYIVRYAPKSTVALVDQATVAAGALSERSTSTAPVTPRGFASLGGTVADRPGSAVVSAGDLWALVGSGSWCQVQQLSPPAVGHGGLRARVRSTLTSGCAAAALESLPVGTGGATLGLAAPGSVWLFRPGQVSPRVVRVPATAGTLQILPVHSASLVLWWLVRSPGGWSVLGVTPAGQVIGPHPVGALGPSARPVPPVEADGMLYTLNQAAAGQPTLRVVDPSSGAASSVSGLRRYPSKSPTEKADFAGAEVLVDGPRVVFNNPDSLLAVVVFVDGSHDPVVVDKSSAVDVSATGPGVVDATTPTTVPGASPEAATSPTPNPQPPAPVAQAVNQEVTCANTTQKPYTPLITSVTPSADAALLSWSYQLLDQTDCEPDSWTVRVTALGGAAQPSQPVQAVNGQNQLQLVGLRPATTYQAVVTAYINQQSTPSNPVSFTTIATGPDAPTAVHTTSDGNGDWVISWTPCSAADCYVPAVTWTVTGTSCGSAYVGRPPAVEVPGAQTTVTIGADSLGLLGTSLSFAVQGATASGLNGNPTSDGTCTEAWRPPNAADIALSASGTPSGQTVTAQLSVTTTGGAVEALGSDTTDFTYTVGDRTVGPTTAPIVTVTGLAGGTTYVPTVVVAPAGHPDASVTVTGPQFSQTVPWPSDLAVQTEPAVDASNPNMGSVTASFRDLPPGPMSGAGQIVCGSEGLNVGGTLQGGQLAISNFDLDSMGGACTLSLTLSDTANPDPYGVASPQLSGAFTIGAQAGYSHSFSVAFAQQCIVALCTQQQLVVSYSGGGQPPAGINWLVTAQPPGGKRCYLSSGPTETPSFPVVLTSPPGCPSSTDADVTVSYFYLGQAVTVDAGTPTGPPPVTTSTTTSTSTTKVAAGLGASPGPTALAAATLAAGPLRAGGPGQADLEWTVVVLGVAWCASAWRLRRRRRPRRGSR